MKSRFATAQLLDHRRLQESIEVTVVCSQDNIDQIANRIERAYRRKHPRLVTSSLSPGVWVSAASRLLDAPEAFPEIPVDPELFVAVQVPGRISPDPWVELTQRCSVSRYLRATRRIIRRLREELRSEVRRAEHRLRRGVVLDIVLQTEGGRISPLSCYILALRADRPDLSDRYRASAFQQHRSCPLYQVASSPLLPGHAYPAGDLETDFANIGQEVATFSLN